MFRSTYSYEQISGWTNSDFSTVSRNIQSNNTEYTITGLEASTKYAVRVFAWNDLGSSSGPTNTELETDKTSECCLLYVGRFQSPVILTFCPICLCLHHARLGNKPTSKISLASVAKNVLSALLVYLW